MTYNATYQSSAFVDSRELFGYNLKRILLEKGVSADDLAKDLKVPRSVIYRWNMGETLPTRYLDKIAKSLKVPISKFFLDPSEEDKGEPTLDEAIRVVNKALGYRVEKMGKK